MALVPGEIVEAFREQFGAGRNPAVYRAPGRVNLIGEHTDYNLGFVFPIALDMACYIAAAPADHGDLRMYSRDLKTEARTPVRHLAQAKPKGEWSDYVVGVAQQLAGDDVDVRALDLYIASEVPAGSGLSSSAALEIASALALMSGKKLEPLEIARIGQRAESQFVGVPCGIMDQYASVFGRTHAAIQIDCRSLTHEYFSIPDGLSIIAANSLVKHELGASAYRDRVAECRAAVDVIREQHPSVESLRDVPAELFEAVQANIPSVPRRRARHVVTENARVLAFGSAARAGDLRAMGELFVQSHRSMQHDYEISCEEIDFLVDTAIQIPGVYGARMTGGGFGGCTVNLVAPEAVGNFESTIGTAYEVAFGKRPIFYRCEPSAGAAQISA